MKKTIVLMIILLLSALLITGCDIINSIVGNEEEHIHKGGSATCVAPAICEECGSVYGEIGEHVYIDADCENPRQCALCSAIDGEALGHDYTAASCTDPATCQRCGAIDGEALGHDYTAASCTDPATCQRCGAIGGEALGHDYTAASCTDPATCQRCGAIDGEALGHDYTAASCDDPATCQRCGAIDGEALGHDYTAASCTDPATCQRCGAIGGEALGHDYTAASCDDPATCQRCGAIDGEALGHDYTAASCDDPATCQRCGAIDGEALGHDYTAASCDDPATCQRCGAIDGEALGHDYTAASCDDPATCQRCGAIDGEALGHDYTAASCDDPATCQRCGAIDGEALGHNYTAASCTDPAICQRCGAIGGEALGHSYNAFYSYNEDVHWIECAVCKNKKDEGEHMGGEISGNERAKCEICSADYGELPSVSIDWVIEAKTPAVGSSFCLANSRIKNWYDTFDFTKTDTDAHWLQEDIFMPEAPFFTWSVGEAAHYYKVYISSSEDFSAYQCYLTATPELYVEHLYTGNTYYWFVDAVYDGYTVRSEVFSFMTAATPRTVNIEGVSNSRDIGGYLTLDGKRIKQGLVYRSAKLDDITELGRYTLLNILGVKTDLDLRGDRNNYYKDATHPVTELNHVVVACPWYSTGGNHIWLDEYNKNEFAKAVKVFADPDNYPIIFHCSLGRDRTGTLAMVLEGLLGVDENTLMMEYELSVFSYWGTNGGTKYNNGLRNLIHDTYLYINNNYEGDTFSQKVEDFLLEIGVSREEIASIKSIMLEEVE